jgi:phenylalanyl-tRNA synthetase alpha chain
MSVSQIEIPHSPLSAARLQRDLSVAVSAEAAASIDDRVRSSLGDRADSLEQIVVLSQTRYMDLSMSLRRRLGIAPGQVHLQLRLVIRDLDRTLTSDDANELRDAVVDVLHEGAVRTWVSREMQL